MSNRRTTATIQNTTASMRSGGVVAMTAIVAILAIAGCASSESAREKPVVAALHKPAETPTSATSALRDSEILLRDVRLHLSAMTGEQTGSIHPTIRQLEADAERIREGVRTLRLEMDMNGLDFAQTMQPFVDALNRHYRVLEQIRDHLILLELQRSPTGTELALSGDADESDQPAPAAPPSPSNEDAGAATTEDSNQ